MAKYEKPRGGQLTLSSTTVVWGISLFLVLLLGGIGGGMYMGYRWGYDAGFQRGSASTPQQTESSGTVERWSLTSDTATRSGSMDTPAESAQTDGYTDEDITFLDEDPEGVADSDGPSEASSANRSTGGEAGPSPGSGETPSLRTGEGGEDTTNERTRSNASEPSGQTFTIQTVSTQHEDRARKVVQQLRDDGHKVRLTEANVDGTLYYRVRVGTFSSREAARSYAEKMVNSGEINDYWISKIRL